MGLRINTNISSLIAQRYVSRNYNALSSNLSRLSSGKRIVKSSDDAAGLAISTQLRANIRSSRQAERNAKDGISLVQVAEGGLNETSNILIRMRELAIQSSSDTIGDRERKLTNMEYQQLKLELQRLAQVTEFNGNKLLDGTGKTYEIQVGIHNNPFNDRISFKGENLNATLDGLRLRNVTIDSKECAQISLDAIDCALFKVSKERAGLGAIQTRLSSAVNNLQIQTENMAEAKSRILDADYAFEVSENARLNVLTNASVAALAQANLHGSQVLKLLG